MIEQARYTWYPLEEPTNDAPKDFLVAAKFIGIELESVWVHRAIREGDNVLVDFIFNGSLKQRLTITAEVGYNTYKVEYPNITGYVTFYNADITGTVAIETNILPALVYDQSEALVTKVRVIGIGSITGWKGTVLDQILEFTESLKLIAGYNCSIEYNEQTNTIYISRAEGMGEGTEHSQCTPPPDGSIIRINGKLLTATNLTVKGDGGVVVGERGDGLDVYLNEDAVKGI